MKKPRRSTTIALGLTLYITVMAIYFLPRNNDMTTDEKWITLGVGYLLVVIVWLLQRKKEQMAARRENDMK